MPESIEVKVPPLGDYHDVPVVEIFVSAGDEVQKEDSLIAIESEKAVMEIPAPAAGKVESIEVKLQQTLNEGDLIAKILATGDALTGEESPGAPTAEKSQPFEPGAAAKEEISKESDLPAKELPDALLQKPAKADEISVGQKASSQKPEKSSPAGGFERDPRKTPHASPSVRRAARTLGADLWQLTGSGPKGRITQEDLNAHIKSRLQASPVASGSGMTGALYNEDFAIDFEEFQKHGEVEIKELSKIQSASGKRLAQSSRVSPHVTQFQKADITELDKFRKSYLKKHPEPKITPLAFIVKAVALALVKFPELNASFDARTNRLILKKYINIGVAVDTPEGLVVPSVKSADQKTISELAVEIAVLSRKAKEKKLGFGDLSGGSFTVSSLGALGGSGFTPIINPPEVAILGVSRASLQPVWSSDAENFAPRLLLPFSLSYDHRVIDGVLGGKFCSFLAGVLSDVREMVM